MGRRGRGARADQRNQAREREALERRWFLRLKRAPNLEALVTASENRVEPFHRWIPYRQGFSPGLVLRFLETGDLSPGPVLDPFSGSGTTAIACARRGDAAIGVEAQASLTRLSGAAFYRGAIPDLPGNLEGGAGNLAPRLIHPVHRAALLCAVAGRLRPDGRVPGGALRDLAAPLRERFAVIRKDLEQPLAAAGIILQGDARRLPVCGGSVGGILTSPPYIARFDYDRITRPLEKIVRSFGALARPDVPKATPASNPQIRAHRTGQGERRSAKRAPAARLHPAVTEAHAALERSGQGRAAGLCSAYFKDMDLSLQEMVRTLAPKAPLWLVVGGAFLYDVYLPSDLILAERLEELGLKVEHLLVARNLAHSGGRRLGDLAYVKPRETLICSRKPAG
jgi:tRNA G10  N-methylase Trm11